MHRTHGALKRLLSRTGFRWEGGRGRGPTLPTGDSGLPERNSPREPLSFSIAYENANSNDMNMSSDDQYSSTECICRVTSPRHCRPRQAPGTRPLPLLPWWQSMRRGLSRPFSKASRKAAFSSHPQALILQENVRIKSFLLISSNLASNGRLSSNKARSPWLTLREHPRATSQGTRPTLPRAGEPMPNPWAPGEVTAWRLCGANPPVG